MGYCLFYDSIIQSVIYARDKFLVNIFLLRKKKQTRHHLFSLRNLMVLFFLIVQQCMFSVLKIGIIKKIKSNVKFKEILF
jgi:hypothetical protein